MTCTWDIFSLLVMNTTKTVNMNTCVYKWLYKVLSVKWTWKVLLDLRKQKKSQHTARDFFFFGCSDWVGTNWYRAVCIVNSLISGNFQCSHWSAEMEKMWCRLQHQQGSLLCLTVFLVFVPPHVICLFLLSHFRLHQGSLCCWKVTF